ncbi:MAG: mechanosensitive ion channel family protein [Burkholderiales bacterium]|nr:mechanosensitive ion channel family protein [Burkholderiales bacterium]MDE2394125.1 mechanosensitive ion channel family protein [Burkholderiales bacterium]MDE2457282.1 mechanosensitive ion channel family protein [Burkholderiales bacterium]
MPPWMHTWIAGNELMSWALAGLWLVMVGFVVSLLKPRLITRLRALTQATETKWDDALVQALGASKTPLIVAIALYPVAANLVLAPRVERWFAAAATVGLFLQLGLWTGKFLDHWIKASRDRAMQVDPETATGLAVTSLIARTALWAVVLLALLDNLGFNVTTLLAGLGVGGIAVGLALQNILRDLFSSLSIVFDKPFKIGHFITIDDFAGTVENIGLKTTRIRSLGGELVVFSNTDLTSARLRNYRSMKERRIVFTFGVDYNTTPEQLEALPGMVRSIVGGLPQTRFDRTHFKSIAESALQFEVVYWMLTPDYTAYMDTQQRLNIALMRACADAGIGFAFPTRHIEWRAPMPLPLTWAGGGRRTPAAEAS